jgi:FlaA1/EpsC-like NDP-sugar epimerase
MRLINRHRLWQVAVDGVLVAVAWWATFSLLFQGNRPVYERFWEETIVAVVLVKAAVFLFSGSYNKWWRYVSLRDMQALVRSVVLASAAVYLLFFLYHPVADRREPERVLLLDLILTLMLVGGARLLTRSLIERPRPGSFVPSGREVLVVGAGDAGGLLLREMLKNRAAGYHPIGLVDDDARKEHMRLHGVRVLGTTSDLKRILREQKPDEVHIAIPSAAGDVRNRVVRACRDEGIPVKTLPSVSELLHGDLNLVGQMREVQVEDLLGREPVSFDPNVAARYVAGQTVLVTGAGGSIGSELVRQLVKARPRTLLLVDHAENNLFAIERELAERGHSGIEVVSLIGDVKDASRMTRIMESYRPTVVFHAAAYKHVRMMQLNPMESVRNNALATLSLARAAAAAGVARFVLVSTDKAVKAQTVMGASKALCEWVIEAMAQQHGSSTAFVAVRFGNVLGSSGSVIPIFRRQIAHGGPVTVTHENMTRFFMTIPEAAQLVIQAGGVGQGGEIFVLDMGQAVRILDLAHDMIRLSGKEPGRDVQVKIVGPSPGEKLHEELFEDWESVTPTRQDKILRATRPPIDADWLEGELAGLEQLCAEGDQVGVVARLEELVRRPRRSGVPALD